MGQAVSNRELDPDAETGWRTRRAMIILSGASYSTKPKVFSALVEGSTGLFQYLTAPKTASSFSMNSLSTVGAMWLMVAMSFFGGSDLAITGLPAAVVAGALSVGGGWPGAASVGGGASFGGPGARFGCADVAGWALAVCAG